MMGGLSLCVQGTSVAPNPQANPQRFIPVCTGNMRLPGINGGTMAVYPCVYREHSLTNYTQLCLIGLSLCVQGTYSSDIIKYDLIRFIPVCTGNMSVVMFI